MNQPQQYIDSRHSHMSTGPSYATQPQTTGGMSHYSQYAQQAPSLQNGPSSYGQTQPSYSQYYGGDVTSPQSTNQPVATSMVSQLLPLPAMGATAHQQHPFGASGGHGQGYPQPTFDSTGQIAPHGVKPRVTATLWEDEGSLCFQVEAKGVCVARREDNHFINGTKLLNVAGMTRGRRDGILKSEKTRSVVKIGPMHLKGVWIPFDRALDFANREKITELLYPLFVHNIGSLLYHPTNSNRGNGIIDAAARRRGLQDKSQQAALLGGSGPHSAGLHHHHSMSNQMPSTVSQTSHTIVSHPGPGRPNLDRAHTFPTPPTSASSIMGTSQGGSYDWPSQSMNNGVSSAQPLAIDTGLSNARSEPATPAATPPGSTLHNVPSYQNGQSYNNPRPMYSTAPQQSSQYATQQQNMARFGQPMQANYQMKNDMGPPSRATGSGSDGDHAEIKQDPYSQGQGNEQLGHGTGEEEAEHEHDADYTHDSGTAYSTGRGSYSYGPASTMAPLHADHPHLSPEQVNGSPHQSGSGRVAQRTSSASQPQWAPGYNTPPRSNTASSLYNVVSDTRGTIANGHSDNYATSAYAPTAMNGAGSSNKRAREDDDLDYKGRPSSGGEDMESLKRRKSGREGSIGTVSGYDHQGQPISRSRSTIIQRGRR